MFDFNEGSPEPGEIRAYFDEGINSERAERRRTRSSRERSGRGMHIVTPEEVKNSQTGARLTDSQFYKRLASFCPRDGIQHREVYTSRRVDESHEGCFCECEEPRVLVSDTPLRRKGFPVLWKPDEDNGFIEANAFIEELDPEDIEGFGEDDVDDEFDDDIDFSDLMNQIEIEEAEVEEKQVAASLALNVARDAAFAVMFAAPSAAAGMACVAEANVATA